MPFGLSFGASKKNESSTTTGSYNKTTMPIVPNWLQQPTQDILSLSSAYGAQDPQNYVAQPNYLIDSAVQNANGLNDSPASGTMSNLIALGMKGAPQISAASLLDNLGGYMSPYTKDVVDTTLTDFDQNAGQTRAQQSLDLARQGAFGGSGAAITQSLTEGELARARASQEATLRDRAFTTGAGLSNSDAARRQEAATTNANLKLQNRDQIAQIASMLDANNRGNIATQAGVGGQLQDLQQQQAQAPLSLLDWRANLLATLNPGLFTGANEYGTETQTSKGKSTGLTFGASAGTKG